MEKNKKIWIGAGCSIAILGIAATIGVLIWRMVRQVKSHIAKLR